MVSQFCEDENGALIYNRLTNGYNGYGNNGYNGNNGNRNGNNGNYATGGYGYRPVTETGTNTDGSTRSDGGQAVTTLHGSKGSSTAHVWSIQVQIHTHRIIIQH